MLNTVIHGDCLEVMREMPDKSVDLLLTDPPYGVGVQYDGYEDTEENWYSLMDAVLPEIIRVSKMAIFPSCQIKRLPWIYQNYPPDWLICWYKGSTGHSSFVGFNDWEPHLVYGRRINQLYMHDFFQTRSSPPKNTFGHPCPKPEEWAEWIIKRVSRGERMFVYDPFVGSGTVTLVAYKLGHSYLGTDISKQYVDIARKRIAEHSQQLTIGVMP